MATQILGEFIGSVDGVLAAILEQSQDCIKLLDLHGHIHFMNANGRVALEVGDFGTVAGALWWTVWPTESADQVREAFADALRGRKTRFEGYCPTQHGNPRWWDVSVAPIRAEDGSITHVLATSRDVTRSIQERLNDQRQRDRAKAGADHSDAVAREMRHRFKNLLAVIGSIARLEMRHAADASDLYHRLERKLTALAQAQDLFRPGTLAVHADDAIRQIVAASAEGERIEIGRMPHCALSEATVERLALLLGELQTNALKHGALADNGGRIVLTATHTEKTLALHWHEDCGREIEPASREGAGIRLIKALGSTPGQPSAIDWHSTGVAVKLSFEID